jgi:hypothetical protein
MLGFFILNLWDGDASIQWYEAWIVHIFFLCHKLHVFNGWVCSSLGSVPIFFRGLQFCRCLTPPPFNQLYHYHSWLNFLYRLVNNFETLEKVGLKLGFCTIVKYEYYSTFLLLNMSLLQGDYYVFYFIVN